MAQTTFVVKTQSDAIVDDSYDLVFEIKQPHYIYGYGYGFPSSFVLGDGDNPYDGYGYGVYPVGVSYFDVLDVDGFGLGLGFSSTEHTDQLSVPEATYLVEGIRIPEDANGYYFPQAGIQPDHFLAGTYSPDDPVNWYVHEDGKYGMLKSQSATKNTSIARIKSYSQRSTGGSNLGWSIVGNHALVSGATDLTVGSWGDHSGGWTGDIVVFDKSLNPQVSYGWGYESSSFSIGDLSDEVTLVATVTKNGVPVSGITVMFSSGAGVVFDVQNGITDSNGRAEVVVKIDSSEDKNLDRFGSDPTYADRLSKGFMEVCASIKESFEISDIVYQIPTLTDSQFGNESVLFVTIPTRADNYGYGYSYGYGFGI